MKTPLRIFLIHFLLVCGAGCASNSVNDQQEASAEESAAAESSTEVTADEDFSKEFGADEPQAEASNGEAATSGFEEFDQAPAEQAATETPAESPAEANLDKSLEDELNNANGTATAEAPSEAPAPTEAPAPVEATPPAETVPAPVVAEETPPREAPAPMTEESPPEIPAIAEIQNIEYKANESGGTIVVEANGPLSFKTRTNTETNQFVLEVPDSKLPDRLKRPFNTRDFNGDIGSIDAYQNAGSTLTRVVVQLRPGASEPMVSQEGNSLLVMSQKVTPAETAAVEVTPEQEQKTEDQIAAEKILSSRSLEEYLSGAQEFYGSPISIEVDDMDLKQALKFIAEESGVNMVIDSGVTGTVSLKLRQVPWDQALVSILKSRQLGYMRQGSVLRIASIQSLGTEERHMIDSLNARKVAAPLVVRLIPISYAKIDDMATQVKSFLTKDRGQVVGDARTSSLVITDTQENIKRIEQVIQSLDIAPPQVLIEGKIVEATEGFSHEFGINWGATGQEINLGGSGPAGAINMVPNLRINPAMTGSNLNAGFSLGTLDILGDLSATLALSESEDKVKILSAPRITALQNQPATIETKTQIPLQQLVAVPGSGVTQSTVFKDITLSLKVTPQVTGDNSVIMNMEVLREFLGSVRGDAQAPINSRSAKTVVIVRNGQTAVIGGIYQDDSTQIESGVPWIRNIPVLGALFSQSKETKNKNELLIFLTPRILHDLGKSQAAAESEEGVIQ